MADVMGPSIPFRIDPATGGVAVTRGPEKIRQNVRTILSTRIQERVMLGDFGTRVHSLVHAPNDANLEGALTRQIREALVVWEPRVLVSDMRIVRKGGEVFLAVDYALTNDSVSDLLLVPLG